MFKTVEKNLRLDGNEAIVDFGRDAFATLEIECNLAQDTDLTICIGERLQNDGRIDRTPGGYRVFRSFSKHCDKGNSAFHFPVEAFQNPYWKTSQKHDVVRLPLPQGAETEITPFRFLELSPCAGDVTLRRREYFCDFDDDAADFKCSNERLNSIWDFCKYSVKATACFGLYIDGNRERRPYEGDAFINQLSHFCCDRNYAIARDTIDFLLKRPTWPKEWRLLMPLIVRDYVLYSGDLASINAWREALERSLLTEYANEDGLLCNDVIGDEHSCLLRDIVDWPVMERDAYEFGELNTVPNAYFYGALLAMHQLTGEKCYADRAKAVKDALMRILYKNDMFVDSPHSCHTALHSVFFPLYFGVTECNEAMRRLILSKGMNCSVYGAHFLLETCFKNGLAQHGLDLMNGTGLRSWQNMLDKGATITMEAWDDSLKPNQDWNHGWATSPANIMPRFVAGIRPIEPAFATFVVEPNFCNLEWVEARQPTPTGEIHLQMEAEKQIQLTVPKGSTAIYKGREYAAGSHELII